MGRRPGHPYKRRRTKGWSELLPEVLQGAEIHGLTRWEQRTILNVEESALLGPEVFPSDDLSQTRLRFLLHFLIYLSTTFPDGRDGEVWLRTENLEHPFNGRCPIDFLCDGEVGSMAAAMVYMAINTGNLAEIEEMLGPDRRVAWPSREQFGSDHS